MRYSSGRPRSVILSEQGFHTAVSGIRMSSRYNGFEKLSWVLNLEAVYR